MKNYAVAAWAWVTDKLGSLTSFAEPIAKALKIAIESGDVIKIRIHTNELREFAQKLMGVCDFLDEAVSDGNLDLYEGSQALVLLNEVVDEAEDVITGVDEDDTPGVETGEKLPDPEENV